MEWTECSILSVHVLATIASCLHRGTLESGRWKAYTRNAFAEKEQLQNNCVAVLCAAALVFLCEKQLTILRMKLAPQHRALSPLRQLTPHQSSSFFPECSSRIDE